MKGQASLIALMLIIAVVLAMGAALIVFFNIQYSKLSTEKAKIASLSRIPASIAVIPVYSEETWLEEDMGRVWCYMVEIANIGSSRVTIWAAFGGGYIDAGGYPRLVSEHNVEKIVMVKAPGGLLEVPACPGDPPGLDLTENILPASKVYTLDELSLREAGNPIDYSLKGLTRIELGPGESRTFYVIASTKEKSVNSWTLVFILSYYNEKPYMVGLYKLSN